MHACAVTQEQREAAAVKGRMGQATKRLFMARRAERMLASYQREGWLEDQPSRPTGRNEIRPAAEMGPIIVCLDTSYSMAGKRETVAKVRRAGLLAWPGLAFCGLAPVPAAGGRICLLGRLARQVTGRLGMLCHTHTCRRMPPTWLAEGGRSGAVQQTLVASTTCCCLGLV